MGRKIDRNLDKSVEPVSATTSSFYPTVGFTVTLTGFVDQRFSKPKISRSYLFNVF